MDQEDEGEVMNCPVCGAVMKEAMVLFSHPENIRQFICGCGTQVQIIPSRDASGNDTMVVTRPEVKIDDTNADRSL